MRSATFEPLSVNSSSFAFRFAAYKFRYIVLACTIDLYKDFSKVTHYFDISSNQSWVKYEGIVKGCSLNCATKKIRPIFNSCSSLIIYNYNVFVKNVLGYRYLIKPHSQLQ